MTIVTRDTIQFLLCIISQMAIDHLVFSDLLPGASLLLLLALLDGGVMLELGDLPLQLLHGLLRLLEGVLDHCYLIVLGSFFDGVLFGTANFSF